MKKVKIGIIILLILNIILLIYLWQKRPIEEKTLHEYQAEVEKVENIEEVLKKYQGSQTVYSLQAGIMEYLQKQGIEQQRKIVVLGSISNGEDYTDFQLQVENQKGENTFYQVRFYNKANLKKSVEINKIEGGTR